jgi:hypothetical protein
MNPARSHFANRDRACGRGGAIWLFANRRPTPRGTAIRQSIFPVHLGYCRNARRTLRVMYDVSDLYP